MADDVTTSVLLRARSPIEAQVVLALLRAQGITAFINGIALADEFAVSQRAMNLAGVTIDVRTADLERARRVVEDARKTGRELGDEIVEAAPWEPHDTEPGELEPMAALSAELSTAMPPLPRRSRVALALGVLGWLAAGFFCYASVSAHLELSRLTSARKVSPWNTVTLPDGWRHDWKDTGHVSTEYRDANHDGMPERSTHYTRARWKRTVSIDANGNGAVERAEEYSATGRLLFTWTDADEDGVSELKVASHGDGSTTTWLDKDQDGSGETAETRAKDGRLVSESHDSQGDGIWEAGTVHYADGTICAWSDIDQDGIVDRRELRDATGALVRVQVDLGLQGYVDEKP